MLNCSVFVIIGLKTMIIRCNLTNIFFIVSRSLSNVDKNAFQRHLPILDRVTLKWNSGSGHNRGYCAWSVRLPNE